jgi:hypothetical protein
MNGAEHMIPWYWIWSPNLHFPWSGSVVQDNAPDLSWFFGAIRPEAGVGSIEKDVFETASYGKQLGLILDVLLPLVDKDFPPKEKTARALEDLKAVYHQIEQVKTAKKADMEHAAVALLRKIEEADPDMLHRVVSRFPAPLPER